MAVRTADWEAMLAQYYRESARALLSQARHLPAVARRERARGLLVDIRKILRRTDGYSRWWAEKAIPDWYRTQDFASIRMLKKGKLLVNARFEKVNELAVEHLVKRAQDYLTGATDGFRHHVSRLMLRPKFWTEEMGAEIAKAEIQGLSAAKLQDRIIDRLVDKLAMGKVIVKGDDGRMYQFDLDYYAGMVGHNMRREATTVATKIRAGQNNHDLIVISPNPSMVGDFCDAYRGKVFSLTGATPGFPLVERLPNGGPPFHPWCKHTASPFIARFYTDDEIEARKGVDETFLTREGRDVGDIAKLWKEAA